MSVINTNITSMISQSNLNKSKGALTTAMERLSSGMRINSAKDDAAGQAIANRMTSQVKGLAQAQRNANDGISVAQTAEGGLTQINENLQRIRELTVQSANGTNSKEDLDSIQAEIGQRLNEINRISEQTDFNGTKVLSADRKMNIQVGANDNETINIGLKAINAQTLGLNSFSVSGDKAVTMEQMVNDFGASGYTTYTGTTYVGAVASAASDIRVDAASGKVTSGAGTQLYVSQTTGNLVKNSANTAVNGGVATHFADVFAGQNEGDRLTVGGVSWKRETAGTDANGNGVYSAVIEGQTVKVSITGSTNNSGASAAIAVTEGSLFMDAATFASATTKFTTYGTNEKATVVALQEAGAQKTGAVLSTNNGAVQNYTVDAGGTVKYSGGTNNGKVVHVQNAGSAGQKLISADDAKQPSRDPLSKLDNALKIVDNLRSDLGAIQNRFESAITNLQTNETNLSAARSRIEDADYAKEVANMTRAQILQQAGTSVLAQANQVPQGVLSLLR